MSFEQRKDGMIVMKKLDRIIGMFETVGMVVTFLGMIVCVTLQIIIRYFQLPAMYWSEELARYFMIYCVFFGVSSGFKTGTHIGVDALITVLPDYLSKWVDMVSKGITLVICALLAKVGIDYVLEAHESMSMSSTMPIPMYVIYIAMAMGFGISVVRILLMMIDEWQTRRCDKCQD